MKFDSLSSLNLKNGFWSLNMNGLGVLRIPVFVTFWVCMILVMGMTFLYLPIWLVFIVLGLLAFITVWLATSQRRNLSRAFENFANENSWQLHGQPLISRLLADLNFVAKRPLVFGKYFGIDAWLYEVGPDLRGTTRSEFLQDLVALTIHLPKPVPTVVLSKNTGKFNLLADSHFRELLGLERLSLEGNFDKNILVYYDVKEKSSALEYLTPDVMEVLLDKPNNLMIYSDKTVSLFSPAGLSKTTVEELFFGMDAIIAEIRHKQKF